MQQESLAVGKAQLLNQENLLVILDIYCRENKDKLPNPGSHSWSSQGLRTGIAVIQIFPGWGVQMLPLEWECQRRGLRGLGRADEARNDLQQWENGM